jgi:uncharacterized protein
LSEPLLPRLWRRHVVEPCQRVEEASRAYLAGPDSRRADVKVIAVLVTAAVVLTLQNYFGGSGDFALFLGLLERLGGPSVAGTEVNSHCYWAAFSFVTYFFIPFAVVRLVFRERLGDYGLKPRGALRDGWIYAVFFCVMVPLLLLVSHDAHFQRTYPFYNPPPGEPLWPNFWKWEAFYFLQFIGLEFFFRGFMVHGTKHRFGVYSIFVMMVPYCMIHYAKPLPETCGAIVAGIVLGFMSLKTGSIWLGTAIHMSVALSMDFLSMWRKGFFG